MSPSRRQDSFDLGIRRRGIERPHVRPLLRDDARELLTRHAESLHQDLAELLPGLPLDFERDADLALGKEATLDEHRADQACGEALGDVHASVYRLSLVRAIDRITPRGRRSRESALDQAVLVRVDDRVHAVSELQRGEDTVEVGADHGLLDLGGFGDLGVRATPRDLAEELDLLRRELVDLRRAIVDRSACSRTRPRSDTSRRATSSASPTATVRIASTSSSGGVSFRRNPLAPARSAS